MGTAVLALRLGYQTADNRGLSGGMRIRVRSWSVDYAYMPFSDGLGQAHQLGLQFNETATMNLWRKTRPPWLRVQCRRPSRRPSIDQRLPRRRLYLPTSQRESGCTASSLC